MASTKSLSYLSQLEDSGIRGMWKTLIGRSISEVRFVLKQGPEHHGVWHFVYAKLPELRMLNQSTFFTLTEIDDSMQTDSACHFVFGDVTDREDTVLSANLSAKDFEHIVKSKIDIGMTLERQVYANNSDRALPIAVVEAMKYVKHMDDGF